MNLLWFTTRGAGAVSLLLLTTVVVLGIVARLGWRSASWPRFLTTGLHRNLALLSIAFLAIHVTTAVVDPYTSLGWAAALVPFSSSYRTFWLGLGVIALDLLLALVLTSLVRRLIGLRGWRFVHWLAYACWPVAMLHGLGAGSDAFRPWLAAIELACLAAVGGAVAIRLALAAPQADPHQLGVGDGG